MTTSIMDRQRDYPEQVNGQHVDISQRDDLCAPDNDIVLPTWLVRGLAIRDLKRERRRPKALLH